MLYKKHDVNRNACSKVAEKIVSTNIDMTVSTVSTNIDMNNFL